jgi:lipoprotein NlpD
MKKEEKSDKKEPRNKLMRRYRLTIHNENKLDNILGFYVSPFWVIISLFISSLLVIGTIYLIFALTPVAEYLPGHVSDRTRERLVNYALTIDSLKIEVEKHKRYTSNIRNILEGNIEYGDTTVTPDSIPLYNSYPIETTQLEQQFANNYEEREKYSLTSQATNVGSLQGINFYRPARGVVIKGFDPQNKHYGIDIAESPDENIVAIWDGIVIMSDYTANDGYTLIIQHNEELVTVYRNSRSLIKNTGDKVVAGEAIATISNSDNNEEAATNKKSYLHLELWHRGRPLDPNIYIAF